MIETSTRTIVAGIFAVLMLTASFASHNVFAATSSTGIMVPLYSYPGSYWTQVIQAKNAHPSVPFVVIINPDNGPGSSIDSTYVSNVQQMQSAGILVLGYVATGYGSNSQSGEESQINSYISWYHVNGIFFDEMANISGLEIYYSTLNNYAHNHGLTLTVGNPGTDTLSSYIGTMDNLVIYENPGLPTLSDLGGWHTSYSKSNFSMIAFGVGSPTQSYITSITPDVSYVYVTNDNLPNPYDTVPSYLSNLAAELDTGSSSTAPSSPTGLTATAASSSQINLSWTAPSSNGGSAITGYKIDRSANGGSTWSTIVSSTGNTGVTYSNSGLASSTTYTYRVSAINAVGTSSPSNTASATTGILSTPTAPSSPTGLTATAASSSQINLSWTAPSSNGGSAITGYKIDDSTNGGSTWSTIITNTGSIATTYSHTGLTQSTTYTYRVEAINSVGTGAASNTMSATPLGNIVPLSVNSVDLSGNAITGLWVELHASNGTILATGYTPITFNVNSGVQYTVYVADYQNFVFNHWDNGSTTANRNVTVTQATSLNAYYSTGPTQVTLTVKSVDLSGNPINGLWTVIKSGGTIVAKGYTPLKYTATSGTTYTVTVSNYQNYVFSHWSDGSTNPTKTITPTQSRTMVAYYNS